MHTIDDPKINSKTDKESILYQASVFNKYCRVFAPRYRQANLEAFYTKNKDRLMLHWIPLTRM